MNKQNFLEQLEKLLLEHKVNNTYSILRDYSNKIDDLSNTHTSFDTIIEEIGSVDDILSQYLDEQNDKKTTLDDDFTESVDSNVDDQFIYSRFEKRNHKAN
ncbi:hypothetical protein LJB88_05570, partial [Erysipelotrichaceae bacterium OttesenSCG-928-M19]|nr:hypothetical protein [Erysipelotrichaceae bacterium OttesenSCG-928-M19]